jgi:hypothetical protein
MGGSEDLFLTKLACSLVRRAFCVNVGTNEMSGGGRFGPEAEARQADLGLAFLCSLRACALCLLPEMTLCPVSDVSAGLWGLRTRASKCSYWPKKCMGHITFTLMEKILSLLGGG